MKNVSVSRGEGAGCNENGRWKNLDGKLIEKKRREKKKKFDYSSSLCLRNDLKTRYFNNSKERRNFNLKSWLLVISRYIVLEMNVVTNHVILNIFEHIPSPLLHVTVN